jgi:YHS domain-containing protein
MAFRKASRSLFTAAAAVALGLQIAPWPSLSAQDRAPATLGAQTQARPISNRRAERRQQNNAPIPQPQPQPAVQPAPVPNHGQSEVQRELQKLYEQNGRAAPEMIDVRQSMGTPPQAQSQPPAQQPQYQPQAQAQQQPQYQAPVQPQQQAYAQPVTQTTPQPATPTAPKKKGLLSKLFGREDNSGPTQPPVEPPYTPPKNTALAAPPALVQQPMQAQPLAQPTTGRPNYGFLFEDEPDQLEQVPSQPSQPVEAPALVQTPEQIPQLDPVQPLAPDLSNTGDGFEAPLFVDAPAQTPAASGGIPALDFSAPIQDPDHDQIELGSPAALSPTAPPVAAVPKKPADPFSDEALFPSEAPQPPAVIAETPVLGELSPVTIEQEPVQPDPVPQEPAQEIVSNEPLAVEPTPPAAEEPAPEMENPYSGLTLDTEPVSTPVEMKPAVELPARPITGNLTPSNSLDHEVTPDLTPPPREAATVTTDSSSSEPPLVVEETSDAPKLTPVPRSGTERTQAKLEMIAARKGLRGLKGFCPVALRDHRDLVDAQSQFRVIYNEKTYYLCSSEAVSEFHSDPAKYAPAARGADVIHLAITGEEQEGTLDHAVWYKGRLYLFSSAETMETFVAAPSSHATLD